MNVLQRTFNSVSRNSSELPLEQTLCWQALERHAKEMAHERTNNFFKIDPERFNRHSLNVGDLLFDYSKNKVTERTMDFLLDLSRQANVEDQRKALFAGEIVNASEGRAALHPALRNPHESGISCGGPEVTEKIKDLQKHLQRFSEDIRSGVLTGATGQRFSDVVNIGIGGSNLGPEMVTEALTPYHQPGLRVHFVSNADGRELSRTLMQCNPERTLFIVSSKTLKTQETLLNTALARRWLTEILGEDAFFDHFVAVTANTENAHHMGFKPKYTFEYWDWVGGRFSLWSAVGLPVILAVGYDRFRELLDGAHAMDRHFLEAPLEKNMPVLMAMLGIWNINFQKICAHAVIPYDFHLNRLPAFLQQLEMESNGKSVTTDGVAVGYDTSPIIFGAAGTDAQHSFFQQLHQGPRPVSSDLIFPVEEQEDNDGLRDVQISHALAQAGALMNGSSIDTTAAPSRFRDMPGNRPTNTLVVRRMDPHTLGLVIALYEHKVFVQGIVWRINSFDQWGVEAGKKLAIKILPELSGDIPHISNQHDSSTRGLIDYCRSLKQAAP